jgi:hypothetical protein
MSCLANANPNARRTYVVIARNRVTCDKFDDLRSKSMRNMRGARFAKSAKERRLSVSSGAASAIPMQQRRRADTGYL